MTFHGEEGESHQLSRRPSFVFQSETNSDRGSGSTSTGDATPSRIVALIGQVSLSRQTLTTAFENALKENHLFSTPVPRLCGSFPVAPHTVNITAKATAGAEQSQLQNESMGGLALTADDLG